MISPSTYSLSRPAPPVQPSQSLEGMEKVIPPSLPVPYAHTISRLHLDKPLPDLPEKPPTPFIGSTAWSDDSSTVNSFEDDHSHSVSRPRSAESYPVFVRSGSADLPDFVDHPVPGPVSTLNRTPSPSADPYHHQIHQIHPKPAPTFTFLTDDAPPAPRYTEPTPQWNPSHRAGPNHYFREKKWDFFPELAIPSSSPHNYNSPRTCNNKNSHHNQFLRPRKKDSGRSRWIPLPAEKGAALANDVRNSIRYIQRRLSRNSLDREKSKKSHRPTTAPSPAVYPRSPYPYTFDPSPRSHTAPLTGPDRDSFVPHSPDSAERLYVSIREKQAMADTSLSLTSTPTGSTISDQSLIELERESHNDAPFYRKKQLAVPISSYQSHDTAIWDRSGKEKKRPNYPRQTPRVRFPKYRNSSRRNSSIKDSAGLSVSPLRPKHSASASMPALVSGSSHTLQQGTRHAVRALQDGTSHVLVAIDGARRKIARSGSGTTPGSKLDRKRTELKSQIRLVGPVNPYTHTGDPWI
ncbi:predicted protein [Aspergillus nidulans FGSC A4]|uniref:Uncharacterized protein n=1 Tax=Emericella nidulans (strain FGSC A4 / ATCC 38163 / CBS 112.46 / NRRL 194 / M139) TaxID=227321 RepID=Q5B943_EMENI|nr:hypothetical protein [Aspergillus nidulans FGSC A4]EAA63508.1 predicted protein [Aspergillus nidulans FGSC A4]CBF83715.1 TPA: conserved hypothetical protein [Aspergillus nidulans FGSC A4]|eukprot:XP_660541.1 predicted protein [Aspergillus nidulans FGSC A4]